MKLIQETYYQDVRYFLEKNLQNEKNLKVYGNQIVWKWKMFLTEETQTE